MDPTDAFALLLIALAVVDVVASVILVRAAWTHSWGALRDRAAAAAIMTGFAVMLALLSLVHLANIDPDISVTEFAIACAMVGLSLPQVIWLAAYWRGGFE